MCGVRPPLFACLLLFSALAAGPSRADVPGTPPAAVVGASEIDWTLARSYDVILAEFRFAPSRIVLQHGVPYTLRLKNEGAFRHTFTTPEFFGAVIFQSDEDAAEAAQSGGSLSLAAGEVKEVGVVPLQAGTYPLECTKPLHSLFGMTGNIVVE